MRHRDREPFHRRFPCHVTIRVRKDVPPLRRVELVRAFERSLAEITDRGEFRVVHYSLQSNHAHFIVEAAGHEALGRGMKSLGARLARAVNRTFERSGPVLEDRYDLKVLRSPLQVRGAIAYVLLSSTKHRSGRGREVGSLDPCSSSRWFDGWKRAGKDRESGSAREIPSPVARARTWLLRTGWRRHGLIDPREVPGPAAARD